MGGLAGHQYCGQLRSLAGFGPIRRNDPTKNTGARRVAAVAGGRSRTSPLGPRTTRRVVRGPSGEVLERPPATAATRLAPVFFVGSFRRIGPNPARLRSCPQYW